MSRATDKQSPRDGYSLGWPLFASIPADIELIASGGSCRIGGIQVLCAVVSLPIDLGVDVVLLPLDVLSGCFGRHKPYPPRRVSDL